MYLKDLQFVRYLLKSAAEIPVDDDILNKELEINHSGSPNNVIDRGNKIICSNPESITQCLFLTTYTALSPCIKNDADKDLLSILLMTMCRDYVYHDQNKDTPDDPLIMSFSKLMIVPFVLNELVKPLAGRINSPKIVFMPCKFTDCCRIIGSVEDLTRDYNVPAIRVKNTTFPAVMINNRVHNKSARDADLLIKVSELSWENEAPEIIKRVLLSEVMSYFVESLFVLTGSVEYVFDFITYLDSYISLTEEENEIMVQTQMAAFSDNKHFNGIVKIADNFNPQINNQWSQWSMLVGLIEKQLGSARGSSWPATEKIGPIEERKKKLILETAQRKRKTQLTLNEMLEVARDFWGHNADEPHGKLVEHFLGDVRVVR